MSLHDLQPVAVGVALFHHRIWGRLAAVEPLLATAGTGLGTVVMLSITCFVGVGVKALGFIRDLKCVWAHG